MGQWVVGIRSPVMKRSLMEWRTVRKPARRNWTGVVLSASIATGLAGVTAQSLSAAPQGGVTAPTNDVDPAAKKLLKASGLFNSGLFKLAAQEYTDFLQQFPTHAEATNARYALAICNYRQQAYEPAIEALTQVLKDEKFAQRDESLAVLGHCNLAAGKNDKALA